MKQNFSTEMSMQRTNALKGTLFAFFFGISSYFRLPIEVFLRRHFGHRYFAFSTAITIIVLLAVFPIALMFFAPTFGIFGFLLKFSTWYAFLAAFGWASWNRKKEITIGPYEVDFENYSKYGGDKNTLFYDIDLKGIETCDRTVSTIFEPGVALLIGAVLALLFQPIGFVLIVCSIVYSLGYMGSFRIAADRLQDIADGLIFQRELQETVRSGQNPRNDKGFEFFDMPIDPEMRKSMAAFMMGQNEVLYAS